MKNFLLLVTSALIFAACSNNGSNEDEGGNDVIVKAEPPLINYSVVNVYPHDTASFTEGLVVHNGQLYESTGGQPAENNFKSWMGPVDLKTGKAIKKVMLDTSYFGEGINIFKGRLYQLTWQDQKGFVYDPETFRKLSEFTYQGQGWSLTDDGTHLIMSDGSNNLRYVEPDSFRVQKIVGVEDNNGPVGNINELEFINGFIYANQWNTNYILKIDPASGNVVGKIDFATLSNEVRTRYPDALEMNGIAYDSAANKIYVTGKAWPHLYEVRF